jgi:diacylglycerol kinase family enzyme
MEPIPLGLSPLAASRPGPNDPASGSPRPRGGVAARPRIGVVRNPRSHRNRGAIPHEPVAPGLLIAAPADREALSQALARFAEERIEVLIVDGGDGTLREVLTRGAPIFGARWPKLLVLPKGKTNALAIDLGMPAKLSLAQALRALPQARTAKRRPILVDPEAGERQVLGFIMGAGVFNAAIAAGQVAHRFGAFQGFAVAVTAAFAVLQSLCGFGRTRWRDLSGMAIAAEGARDVPRSRHGAAGRRFAAGFSTLHSFPLGMRPFAGAGEGIRYLVVDAPLRRVIALVPAILMGLDRPFLRRLGVHRGAADAFTLDLDGRFILDGEAFAPGRYRLRLGPELDFLVP